MERDLRPAIIAVGYNRPASLKRLLASIGNAVYDCDDISLVISLDRSDVSAAVLKVCEEFSWEHGLKRVRIFDERQGLRSHLLQCGDLTFEYGAVIVLEDDIVVSPFFYSFAVAALSYYEDDASVAGVSLYSHRVNEFVRAPFTPVQGGADVFFAQFSCTWGQCWSVQHWSAFRAWYAAHSDGVVSIDAVPSAVTGWPASSWGKYFVHYIVECGRYYVVPYVALSTNYGDAGQHNAFGSNAFQVPLLLGAKEFRFTPSVDGVKYDAHFAQVDFDRYFPAEIREAGLCVDLYGSKSPHGSARYYLTMARLPFRTVQSFGLAMRPVELNIVFGVEGDLINLYDTEVSGIDHRDTTAERLARIRYWFKTLSWRDALLYGVHGLYEAFMSRLPRR